MNEKIKELAEQSKLGSAEFGNGIEYYVATQEAFERFAELIVQECITECKQEWYELNAESVADDDPFRDPRATGIRVGQKNGILKCIGKIQQHFGVQK